MAAVAAAHVGRPCAPSDMLYPVKPDDGEGQEDDEDEGEGEDGNQSGERGESESESESESEGKILTLGYWPQTKWKQKCRCGCDVDTSNFYGVLASADENGNSLPNKLAIWKWGWQSLPNKFFITIHNRNRNMHLLPFTYRPMPHAIIYFWY